jgi:hypothetical protein
MTKPVTAPEIYIPQTEVNHKIFLAGAIDMGAAVDWQAWVIDQLKAVEHLVIFNPRRVNFTPDTLDEQIVWELEALEMVNTIFMWFPKGAKAPISFFEAGLYWKSGKLLVGAEPGFYRRRNLELTAERYSLPLHASLQSMIDRLKMSKG